MVFTSDNQLRGLSPVDYWSNLITRVTTGSDTAAMKVAVVLVIKKDTCLVILCQGVMEMLIFNSAIFNTIMYFLIAEVVMEAGAHHWVPSTGCVCLWVCCGGQTSGDIRRILWTWWLYA